jgi:hypothetical protein
MVPWNIVSSRIYKSRAGAVWRKGAAAEQQTRLLVSRLAAEYQVAPEAIVLAWLLRHPAQIQPVIGTSKVERLQAAVQAQHISLSRQHWYQLYIAARGAALP